MSDFTTTIAWFRRLAKEGGKGVVNNIDARSLGRIADEMETADRKHEALIERLDGYIPPKGSVLEALHNDIRHALSRPTAPPPDEIAGLIKRLQKRIDAGAPYEPHGELDRSSIAALRALAQENERLMHALSFAQSDLCKGAIVEAAHARIREVEAERDQFAEQAAARDNRDRDMQEIMRINNELVAERDAIRRKGRG